MNSKCFFMAISISLLAFSADAQEQRLRRELAANPMHRNFAIAEVSRGQMVLSLSDLVAEALKNNPEIQVAKRKVEVARARAGQATYLEDPEVNLEAWGIPLNRPLSFRSANPIVLGLRQKFPFFGKLGLKGEIAGEEVNMVKEELRAKEVEIVAKVKSAYADFFMANKSIEIQKELLELVRQASLTADNLYRVGKSAATGCHQSAVGADGHLEQIDLDREGPNVEPRRRADVMKRIAAPMIGGVISSFLLELMVYPVIFEICKGWGMRRSAQKV